ncbi:MAG: energy transducer TonB [Reichenbachiella sp.]|uniref:energy transducer TonB n=1 Tax=Reichenbachiella sp. TaxID=2184521 RepID=UPI003264E795
MKTITKKNVTQSKRRETPNYRIRKHRPAKEKTEPLVLRQNDYADLIEIKAIKNQRNADQRVMLFWFGMSLALATMIVIFNWKFYSDRELITLENLENTTFEEVQDIPITQQPPPPPKIIQQPKVVAVPDEIIIKEVEVVIDVETTEEMAVEEVEFLMEEVEEEKAEEIFHIVEEKPEPIGGLKAFYDYVSQHMTYPVEARKMQIQGRVFIRFVVDSDGSIVDVIVLKGIGGGCDEEAVRIVKNAPKWKPGKQRGKPVKVYMTLPIIFRLYR